MKKLLALIVVAVLATAMAMAAEGPGDYGWNGTSKTPENIVKIYTNVASVPLVVTPLVAYLDLRTGFATKPGEETPVATPGQFNQYIIFDVTSAKGYGIQISGGVTAPTQGDTQLSLGVYTTRLADGGVWYNDIPASTWPIAKTGTTIFPAGFAMNHGQNSTGEVKVLLNVENIKVDLGAVYGDRTFSVSVIAEYAEI